MTALVEGLRTYAEGQAQLPRDLSLKFSGKRALLLAGEVSDEDVGVVESDDDGAGAGSSEEATEEVDEEFTCDD